MLSEFLDRLIRQGSSTSGFCLAFHAVDFAPLSPIQQPPIVTDPAGMRRILEEAARIAEPVRLMECKLPAKWFAVSFDDGFRDNVTCALPILEELKLPATLFATSGFAKRTVVPYEIALAKFVCHDRHRDEEIRRDQFIQEYECLRTPLKLKSHEDRRQALRRLQISDELINESWELFLSEEELCELSRHRLIDLGAHGLSHVAMTSQSKINRDKELRESKRWLEDLTSSPCDAFAFPYGAYDKPSRRAAQAAGFQKICTTRSRIVKGAAPILIDRIVCDGKEALGEIGLSTCSARLMLAK